MKTWAVQDAKAHFSEFLKASLTVGPQVVTYHGARAAVLLPVAEWERLKGRESASLKALLLGAGESVAASAGPLALPVRGQLRRRMPPAL
jgi:prevent-host-death family protein